MSPTLFDRARRGGAFLLIAGSAAFLATYLFIAFTRIGYPFELEWMEGGMVDHVGRVLSGSPLYGEPSIEFVSFLYPPLYYDAAALISRITGPGFLPLRLLSLAASLGVFALLFQIVRRETGAALPGVVAAGLYVATYDRVGGWFDLARLDSFYVLLLLGGVHVLRRAGSPAAAAGAGLLIGAAFFTKQSALVIALPLVLAAALIDLRRAAWFTGVAGGVMGAGTLLLDGLSGGWFRYYCFFLPSRHPRIEGGWAAFWTTDLLPALPVATCLAAAAVALRIRGRGPERFFFPLAALGMLGSSWSVRNMVGAEVNNLLPVFAAVALLAALGLHELLTQAGAGTATQRIVALVAMSGVLAQLGLLAYEPRRHLPTRADRAAGERLVARLTAIPGEVYTPHHGYLARLAGKRSHAHTLAMDNVFLDDDGPQREALAAGMLQTLSEHRFAAVLLESDGRYGDAILMRYRAVERLFTEPDVFWPVTGGRLRPELLCLPNPGS